MPEYAVLVHHRETENDPNSGTVMYTTDGTYWHAMVTGHMDYCNEVVDALCYREHDMAGREARRD